MNASFDRRPWVWLVLGCLAGLTGLMGCSDDLGTSAACFLGCADPDGGDFDGAQPDLGPGDAGCDGGRCLPPAPRDLQARCEWLDALPFACTDLDGDCHPGACEGPLPAGSLDCADDQADAHPSQEEICDARDNDCDGLVDEALGVGEACDDGCGEGKVECAALRFGETACSTSAGQSQWAGSDELCNGEDDDCDGQVDERCRIAIELPGPVEALAASEDTIVVVAGETLLQIDRAGDTQIIAEGAIAWPSVSAAGVAWLEPGDEGCPVVELDGLSVCPGASLFVRPDGGVERSVGLGDFGPPVAAGESIWWHAMLGDGPAVQRAGFEAGGGLELPFGRANLSDPAPESGGLVAVREWTDERPVVVVRRESGDISLGGSGGRPGPPALSATWVVWSTDQGAGLWAVELGRSSGFLVVGEAGPHQRPNLVRDRVLVWLSGSDPSTTINALDLETGARWALATGAIAPARFAVSGGWVTYHDGAASPPGIYRIEVPGGD